MLSFRKNPFVGESVKGKYQKLVARIEEGKRVKKGVTLIAYASNGKDLFDLLPANGVKSPLRKNQYIYVLGMAGSREEAMKLVQELVTEVYGQTGGFDVRGYFGVG